MKRAAVLPRPVSRLAATFAALRARRERALVAYFTAGDPSLAMTRRLVGEAARRGADVIELGIPFSDPLADGPVIQRATQRALAAGVTLPRVLELVREMRGEVSAPLVFLTYYNPSSPWAQGLCRNRGGGGHRRRDRGRLAARKPIRCARRPRPAGLDVVHLVARPRPRNRMRKIARASQGFIYMSRSPGHRGAQHARRPSSPSSSRPAATSRPSRSAWASASARQPRAGGRGRPRRRRRVVGSAIVRLVEQYGDSAELLPVWRFHRLAQSALKGAGDQGRPVSP